MYAVDWLIDWLIHYLYNPSMCEHIYNLQFLFPYNSNFIVGHKAIKKSQKLNGCVL